MATYSSTHDLANERYICQIKSINLIKLQEKIQPTTGMILDLTPKEILISGKFSDAWVGHERLDSWDVSILQLIGKEQYATCSEEIINQWTMDYIDGLGGITIPKFDMTLDEVVIYLRD